MQENDVPEIVKKRIELAGLFYPLERKLQRRWAKALLSGFEDTVAKLDETAKDMNYVQTIAEDKFILWSETENSNP